MSCEKSFGAKFKRVGPYLRVSVYLVEVDEKTGASRDVVATDSAICDGFSRHEGCSRVQSQSFLDGGL